MWEEGRFFKLIRFIVSIVVVVVVLSLMAVTTSSMLNVVVSVTNSNLSCSILLNIDCKLSV